MNSTAGHTKIIYSDPSERDKVIGQQIGENYRLESEKLISEHRIAMVFIPIIFKVTEEPPPEVKKRYWVAKKKIDAIALNKNKSN